jgi:hypothetical protein
MTTSPLSDAAYHLPRPEKPLAFTGERMTSDKEARVMNGLVCGPNLCPNEKQSTKCFL